MLYIGFAYVLCWVDFVVFVISLLFVWWLILVWVVGLRISWVDL